ncbi:MAG: hypothetical protein HY290_18140 [Planctomycetia bacterium]|nr:hypothetical protein [Planctomycetia bacterium]
MKTRTLVMALLTLCLLGADKPDAMRWNFEDAKVGELPKDWSAAKTGEGEGSVWKLQADESAPAGSKVLTQTSSAGANAFFNLCVADKSKFGDVDLSVSIKALTGKIDQGGGLVWRYQDAKNYYIARLNPLEGDFRLFKVINGKRTQIGATIEADEPAGKWHAIRVVHRGSAIQCYLSGKLRIEAQDDALKEPGKVGLWSKADAVSSFDDVTASAPKS